MICLTQVERKSYILLNRVIEGSVNTFRVKEALRSRRVTWRRDYRAS